MEDSNPIPIETINIALDTDRALRGSKVAKEGATANNTVIILEDTTMLLTRDKITKATLRRTMTTNRQTKASNPLELKNRFE